MMPADFSAAAFQAQLTADAVGRFLIYRSSVESTMVLARREADEGAPHGTLILAEEQTAGRGRRGRSFFSPPGENLYFTLVLRLPIEMHRRLPLVIPVAVCEALHADAPAARIKWPNDIWVGERKLCGMLIDAELPAGTLPIAMPGVGINVNGDPTRNPELREIATSVAREAGRSVSREAILARVCNGIEAWLSRPAHALAQRYEALSMIVGRDITVQPAAGARYDAVATAISEEGALLVRMPDGQTQAVVAADVSVRPRDAGASPGPS
jgi:BirA family transcriptional regulator, biotin operon repressor / biotin---[acetyl-CoA-carboxylase] ligase